MLTVARIFSRVARRHLAPAWVVVHRTSPQRVDLGWRVPGVDGGGWCWGVGEVKSVPYIQKLLDPTPQISLLTVGFD